MRSSLWQKSSITSRGQIHWFRPFRTSEWNRGQMKNVTSICCFWDLSIEKKTDVSPNEFQETSQQCLWVISHQIIFILKPYILTGWWVVTRLCVLFSDEFFSIKSPERWKSRALMFSTEYVVSNASCVHLLDPLEVDTTALGSSEDLRPVFLTVARSCFGSGVCCLVSRWDDRLTFAGVQWQSEITWE